MPLPGWMLALRNLLGKKGAQLDEKALQLLREKHNNRCVAFKLLIASNNQALEIIADLEEALQGQRPFGMHYVRSRCARLLACVYQIVQRLEELSEAPCTELQQRYKSISAQIQAHLAPEENSTGKLLVVDMQHLNKEVLLDVGPKVSRLADAAAALHLRIPEGFVLTAAAFRHFIEHNSLQAFIDDTLHHSDVTRAEDIFSASSAIQQALLRADMPPDLLHEIQEALVRMQQAFSQGLKFAVRSCALEEDTLETSFAGQYRSEINIAPDDIAESCKQVFASKYGVTAMSYRLAKGILDREADMSVACMRMIDASAGGVVYTRNPVGIHERCLVVNMVLGLPCAVVDGKGQSDLVLVDRGTLKVIRRTISLKRAKYVCSPDAGIVQVATDKVESLKPALNDDELLNLARICLQLEEHFGLPQDIEFALDQDRQLYILQCRPLKVQDTVTVSKEPPAQARILLQGGVTASQGAASGEVFSVLKAADLLRCPAGAVAVALRAEPHWAPLLHRVAAFVTEEGSVAGHLGNVAREFEVPAIFGLEGCLKGLSEAGLVTVDADRCRIYHSKVDELLQPRPRRKGLMQGSAVHARLKTVMQLIAPLHLMQPDSPEFTPANCRTLHDITRYCHELSVRLMFRAGQDQEALQHMSMQLFHKVAMQYWIIDLGGGVAEGERKRFVLLEDIRSVPMLALWRGMTAVPVESAPVDLKGFLSVLSEASSNPELESGARSSFTMRNYFMISQEFCNLQSRFGFHFCTVEALIGDTNAENYIAFQFKGGAADLPRRHLRARMVADLLEERGFRCEVKQDALFARLEGLERGKMQKELEVVGYLVMHTRQLDMLMADIATMSEKKLAMQNRIQTLTSV